MKICATCKIEMDISCFTSNKSKRDGLNHSCRLCHAKYRKNHYDSNKPYYMAKAKKFSLVARKIQKEMKKSAQCADCAVRYPNEPWLMEFDHLPGFEKMGEVSRFANNGKTKAMREEIAKCEIVCLICHKRRTASRANWTP